jgi:hypothetical protein
MVILYQQSHPCIWLAGVGDFHRCGANLEKEKKLSSYPYGKTKK